MAKFRLEQFNFHKIDFISCRMTIINFIILFIIENWIIMASRVIRVRVLCPNQFWIIALQNGHNPFDVVYRTHSYTRHTNYIWEASI